MFSRLRRPASLVLLALVLTSLLVTGPLTPPASAMVPASVDTPPKPVTIPGSAYKGDKITPLGNGSWYNRGISGNFNQYVKNNGPGLLFKRSVPYMVLQSSNLIYTFASGSTTDFSAWNPLDGVHCSFHGGCSDSPTLGHQIIPNDGIVATVPGWFGGSNVIHSLSTTLPANHVGSAVTFDVVSAPAFGSFGPGGFTMTVTTSGGQCLNNGWPTVNGTAYAVYWDNVTGKLVNNAGGTFDVGYPCGTNSSTKTYAPSSTDSRYTFDHIEAFRQNAGTDERLSWYPEGHVLRPTGISSNPRRQLSTRWKCFDGSEGSAVTAWYTEEDDTLPVPKEANCLNSDVVEYTISQITEGLAEREEMYRWVADEDYLKYLGDWSGHPDKDAPLDLGAIGAAGQVISCFSDPAKCVGWYDKEDKADTMLCTKGAIALALTDCNAYRPTFDPDKQAKGQGYADPRDAALPDPNPLPATPAPAPSGGACFPSGWSVFNPVEWVLKPVSCALVWAFVPEVALGTRVDGLVGQVTGTGLTGTLTSGIGFITRFPVLPNSCPDWEIKVAGEETNVVCDSSFTHALVAGRPVIAFFMIATAISPLLRSLWYAVFPLLKPVPTGA